MSATTRRALDRHFRDQQLAEQQRIYGGGTVEAVSLGPCFRCQAPVPPKATGRHYVLRSGRMVDLCGFKCSVLMHVEDNDQADVYRPMAERMGWL